MWHVLRELEIHIKFNSEILKIILRWIFKEQTEWMWTGFNGLKKTSSAGLLRICMHPVNKGGIFYEINCYQFVRKYSAL